MTAVMIDTCAWIDFLRSKDNQAGNLVALAIERNEARLCGVITAELLQGCKHRKDEKQLDILFSTIASIPTIEEDWINSGHLMGALRKKGVTVPLTDALITTISLRCSLPVLTIDKHFSHLSVELFPLSGQ